MSIVIAVDGTAASGKGTLAKRLALHFGYAYLDSGALYRLTALTVLKANGDPANELDAMKAAQSIDLDLSGDPLIRTAAIGRIAAVVAKHRAVREALLSTQKEFAAAPPGDRPGAVIDGRDIGTVVCPDADVKFFVDADPRVRSHRRFLELSATEEKIEEEVIFRDLLQRDEQDRARALSPLKPAADAILIDTSYLSVSEMVEVALGLMAGKSS